MGMPHVINVEESEMWNGGEENVGSGEVRNEVENVGKGPVNFVAIIKTDKVLERDKDSVSPSFCMMKILSALFYAAASFFITVVNKVVLTSYKFPSFQFLLVGQLCTTVVVLFLAKQLRLVIIPPLGRDSFRKIFPLPIFFIGNAITGLGGTKTLSLPMFTALRRFSILITMGAERFILGVHHSIPVQVSVYTMIGGAVIAARNDLCFSVKGYTMVTLNNIFTAANDVYTKKKLESKQIGNNGLMFYNALFMVIPAFTLAYFCGEIHRGLGYEGWTDPGFLTCFLVSCAMGFILNASTVLSTEYNSALTTAIVGCLKNISVAYLGMFIGGDYVFQWLNFTGINISVLGTLLYAYVTLKRSPNGNSK